MIDWIKHTFNQGAPILELGSGHGTTAELYKDFKLYSVEHDRAWVGLYNSPYIYAPLVNGWYHPRVFDLLPKEYSLLIIDGPPGKDRLNIIHYWPRFNQDDAFVVIDDSERDGLFLACLFDGGYRIIAEDRSGTRKQWVALGR